MTGNTSAQFKFRAPNGSVGAAITSNGNIWQNISYAASYQINSDKRLKNKIVTADNALEKILSLRGTHYEMKDSVEAFLLENVLSDTVNTSNNKSQVKYKQKAYGASATSKTTFGFIAQEVETVLPELVATSATSAKSVNYVAIIPLLVEAIREQQVQIDKQQSEIKKLKSTKSNAREESKSSTEKPQSIAYLYQNTPNPFSQETSIKYSVPETVQDAFISITDLSGKQLKFLPISTKGESTVMLKANELYAGIFVYTLVADGNIVDSKRMVIVE